MSDFAKGVAFICEGSTERVFYNSMLDHYISTHTGYKITKEFDRGSSEFFSILSDNNRSVIIKTFSVGTIIAHTQASVNWFKNSCKLRFKGIEWTVFLCYDTDSHNSDISQFHEGDWIELKKSILKNRRTRIIDLAASADIEDVMLLDINGVCSYLGIPLCPVPQGRKGKSKMKRIFRENGSCYHEGERAKPLIDHLDKEIIIRSSSIPFNMIDAVCFK